ncbi:MAG TPA: ferrochelatase [Pirellulaceae bacterium]|nr:ferrochelatase [Pirellulaceae bacterium]
MLGPYDALLIVSFGGPEGQDDVMPFLENVLRGKPVPRERMLEVAEHYRHFGGVSPINAQNRELIGLLRDEFAANGIDLPIYWGNRNWHPLIGDTLRRMQQDGVRRCLAFMTSAFSSYSGCRQYRENLEAARTAIGPDALQFDKIRVFYNHPGFIEPSIRNVAAELDPLPAERRAATRLVFTAHSIPTAMATGSRYETQLREACRLVGEGVGKPDWDLVFQSRSGPPNQPWLEPDILDHLTALHEQGIDEVVVLPIGFVSDHLEVLYDLDTEARDLAERLGMRLHRAATVGNDPRYIAMIRELVVERALGGPKAALGSCGASHDVCPEGCCPSGRPPAAVHASAAAGAAAPTRGGA